jgi:PAS domain S-box-containing protein
MQTILMNHERENIIFDPVVEKKRLRMLEKYDIDDYDDDIEMDQLAKLIAHICNVPIALISFMHESRQVFKGRFGIEMKGSDRNSSFCQYTILQDEIFEVPDASKDTRFVDTPFVAGFPYIRFYAGIPLITQEGYKLGSLCVIDSKPNILSEEQRHALKVLSDVVILNLELKTKKLELEKEKLKIEINEKRYRGLFELSQGLIGEHDMNGRIISANFATAKSLEIPIEKLIGKNMRDTLAPDTRDQFDFYLEKIAMDGYAEGVMHVKTTTGKSRYWAYKNVKVEDNGYPFVLCSSQDVTDLINMEKELRRAQKITQLSIEAKQQFLAKVTHEIRTPMNAIVGFGKILSKTTLENKQRKYVDAINTSGENLLLIVNDLLDTSKIEAGKMTFEEIPFSLKEVIASVITILHYKAAEKDLILSVKIEDDIPEYLIGDPTRLNQVLINLAGNAVKFTEKGVIEIFVKKEKSEDNKIYLTIDVSDTGIGIPEGKLPYIFDSFIQANNDTSRKYGGTGLGLTIAKQIVELQGGTIEVQSTLGKGTVFSFHLSYATTNSETVLQNKIPEEIIVDQKLDHVKILLAEDNYLNHLLLESIMTEWGVEMSIAQNGKKAIEMLEKDHYDLILMDVHMPEMDGYEATRFIRNNLSSPLSQIPIIAITANASEEDKAKCLEAGMDDFVPKPFRTEELFQKISLYTSLKKETGKNLIKKQKVQKTENKKKVIRLGYLKSVASGNKNFLKEVMDIFITQMPEEIQNLEIALAERNWNTLAETAHKMKLGINVMGMKESEKIILFIETESKEEMMPDEILLKSKIEKLKERCLLAVEEVKELMLEWKL